MVHELNEIIWYSIGAGFEHKIEHIYIVILCVRIYSGQNKLMNALLLHGQVNNFAII